VADVVVVVVVDAVVVVVAEVVVDVVVLELASDPFPRLLITATITAIKTIALTIIKIFFITFPFSFYQIGNSYNHYTVIVVCCQ
jgi:hypothetical protein